MTAAETGHLLLSTLHTVGAAKTIDRIVDVFPANQQQQVRVQLSMVLQAVVSQQLIPCVDGSLVPAFEIMRVDPAIASVIRDGKVHQFRQHDLRRQHKRDADHGRRSSPPLQRGTHLPRKRPALLRQPRNHEQKDTMKDLRGRGLFCRKGPSLAPLPKRRRDGENAGGEAASLREAPLPQTPSPEELSWE